MSGDVTKLTYSRICYIIAQLVLKEILVCLFFHVRDSFRVIHKRQKFNAYYYLTVVSPISGGCACPQY